MVGRVETFGALKAFICTLDTERDDGCLECADEGESGLNEAGDGNDGVAGVTKLPLRAVRGHAAVIAFRFLCVRTKLKVNTQRGETWKSKRPSLTNDPCDLTERPTWRLDHLAIEVQPSAWGSRA